MKNLIYEKATLGKNAAQELGKLNTNIKNNALIAMSNALWENRKTVLEANSIDIKTAKENHLSPALLDRLLLTETRIKNMVTALKAIVSLPDPVGKVLSGMKRPNGLEIINIKVPLGVIGIIYEARPNVTVDSIGLSIKSGNCIILRGGSEAINSNKILAQILAQAAYLNGIPQGAIQFIEDTNRENITFMLQARNLIDVIIPRGGKGLIDYVVEHSLVPVIETGAGVCHVYVDDKFDSDIATNVIINAKTSRPAVCNAIETVLINEKIAKTYLPTLIENLKLNNVEIRGDKNVCSFDSSIKLAEISDWYEEYGDLILSIKIVKNMSEAISHISQYGSHHSEAIITTDYNNAKIFQASIDAAAVYVNASTRFTDGEEFGFGGEIGISTQKLHIRGPMGLDALTTNKYLIMGNGQIR